MDGMLSQDEINALLNGMDLTADLVSGLEDETEALDSAADTTIGEEPASDDGELLTEVERDAIGEVANISM